MSKIAFFYNTNKNIQENREGMETLPYKTNKNTQVTLKLLGLIFWHSPFSSHFYTLSSVFHESGSGKTDDKNASQCET